MACFLVPGAEAIVVSAAVHHMKKKEAAKSGSKTSTDRPASFASSIISSKAAKLALLANLLWGGVVLLAFEHLWHGEIAFTFPFLTAIGTDAQASMLQEMATVGVGMACSVTAVWALALLALRSIAQRNRSAAPRERAVRAEESAA